MVIIYYHKIRSLKDSGVVNITFRVYKRSIRYIKGKLIILFEVATQRLNSV
jgi:hypothetical protein